MNFNTFAVTLITLVSILVTCLSGCEKAIQIVSPDATAADPASTVKIGVIQPSGIAVSFAKGAELARVQINDNSGVLGMPVEFLIRDNQGDRDLPDTAESVHFARELIEQEGVVALLGPLFSTNSEQVGPVVNQLRRPMIPASLGQNVTTIGGKFVFLIVAPSSAQAATMAEFVTKDEDLNVKTAAILLQTEDVYSAQAATMAEFVTKDEDLNVKTAAILLQTEDVYSANVVAAFEANFQKSSGEIVSSEIYQRGDRAFDAQLMNIKAAAPDALFISGFNPEVPLIMKQARLCLHYKSYCDFVSVLVS